MKMERLRLEVDELDDSQEIQANTLIDLLKKIFQFHPDKRIGAVEAIKHPWIAKFVL